MHRSQGYAWLKNGDVYFDFVPEHSAVQSCRLEPQQINSRYWQQCEQTAIAANDSGMRHSADLIWSHLKALKSQYNLEKVIFVVPSHYHENNLQLLLGIAKASDLDVQGVVNKAAFQARKLVQNPGAIGHIDVQLHQTVCSTLSVQEDSVKLVEVEVLHEAGLQPMQDALLREIQHRFIQSDRFDPLHYAETEQQLFDQLPDLASQIYSQAKANCSVFHEGQQHATTITLAQWQSALQGITSTIMSWQPSTTLDGKIYDFNGFAAIRPTDSADQVVSQKKTSLSELETLLQRDESGKVVYQSQLPCDSNRPPESAGMHSQPNQSSHAEARIETHSGVKTAANSGLPNSIENSDSSSPTHVLHAGIATSIAHCAVTTDANELRVVAATNSSLSDQFDAHRLSIVGDSTRRDLRLGDRIESQLAEGIMTLIRVEN